MALAGQGIRGYTGFVILLRLEGYCSGIAMVRISTDGSVPTKPSKAFIEALRQLLLLSVMPPLNPLPGILPLARKYSS